MVGSSNAGRACGDGTDKSCSCCCGHMSSHLLQDMLVDGMTWFPPRRAVETLCDGTGDSSLMRRLLVDYVTVYGDGDMSAGASVFRRHPVRFISELDGAKDSKLSWKWGGRMDIDEHMED